MACPVCHGLFAGECPVGFGSHRCHYDADGNARPDGEDDQDETDVAVTLDRLKPGDRVFAETGDIGRRKNTGWVNVTAVGRKWATYDDPAFVAMPARGRFDVETLIIDGGNYASPGRVWRTEEEYRLTKRANLLWDELVDKLCHSRRRPEGIDAVAVLKAADALGIRLSAE